MNPESPSAPEPAPADRPDVIARGLKIVRRRVFLDRLLSILFLDLLVVSTLLVIFLATQKLLALDVDVTTVVLAGLGASLVVSLVRGSLTARASAREAAILIDQGLDLKERISTTVYLREDPVHSKQAWAPLVEKDGERALGGVDLARSFPLRIPPRARWLLAPLAVALALYFVPDLDLLGLREERQAEAEQKEQISREIEKAVEELQPLDAEEKEDPEFEEFVEKLKEELRKELEPKKNPEEPGEEKEGFEEVDAEGAKKGALVQLSRMEKMLKERLGQEKYKELEELMKKNQLDAAKLDDELARKLRDALEKGDFQDLEKSLQELQEELERLQKLRDRDELTKEDRDRMARLSQDLQKLAQMAKEQSEKGEKSGDSNQSQMNSMSQALQQMAQQMKSGNMKGAKDGLEKMQMSASELAQLQKQMEYLEKSLQQLKQSRQNLAQLKKCKSCGKSGQCNKAGNCSSCSGQGKGQGQGLLGPKGQSLSTGPREGIGAGQGKKGTPEPTTHKREHLRDQELDPRGTVIATLEVEGEIPKGEARARYSRAARAAQTRSEQVDREAIPLEYRDQVRRYMNSLVETPAGTDGGSEEAEDR